MGTTSDSLGRRTIAVDAAFCRFNARRSTDPRPSRLEERRVGNAVAFRDTARADSFYYNRVLPTGPEDLLALDSFAPWFHDAGIRCGVEAPVDVLTPVGVARLEALGFTATDGMAFHHVALPAGPAALDERVRLAGPSDVEAVLDLIEEAFRDAPAPAGVRDRYRDEQIVPHFPTLLLEEHGRPVAMATFFEHDGMAWLGNAYTRPAHRRRGHQLALLRHRLAVAHERGLTEAVSDVTAGTVSQRNVERAGLVAAFETRRWVLPVSPGDP